MKIKVTAKHIRNGTALSMCNCPVALALKERLHKYVSVNIDQLTYLPFSGDDFVTRVSKVPRKVKRFMKLYDTGKDVRPFSFEVSFGAPRTHYVVPWELK